MCKCSKKRMISLRIQGHPIRMDNTKDAPFNMAMLYYIELSKLRIKKTECMLLRDTNTAYECLQEMFTIISFKLDKKEMDDLSKKFDNLSNLIQIQKLKPELQKVAYHKIVDLIRIIDREMLRYMDKYKMIFPKIETTGGLDNLAKKYGL